jgi:NAD(P)-dependent dehydrogenase (short-subunit alcohol dehydrogenase family)
MKSFQNKTAVITGAASGLGRSFAVQLCTRGANLALCDLDEEGLEETGRLVGGGESRVSLHHVDVSDLPQMEQFTADVLAHHPAVDLLINNAGISLTPQTFEETGHARFKKVVDVNFWGVYNGIRAFLPHLKARSEACIVNISSTAGLVGLYGYSAYSVSKTAVRGLSEALAQEFEGTGVSVLVVHPGGVKTNIILNAPDLADEDREASHQQFTQMAFLDPDKAALRVLRAVQKKRHRLILGPDARLIYSLSKVFPRSYPKILQTIFSQATFRPED